MVGVKIEWCIALPRPTRHQPYIALYVAHWGHRHIGGEKGWHRCYDIGLMMGRYFTGRGWSKWWHPVSPFIEKD
jgi:hypothetical protein